MWYDEAVVYQIYPLGLCGAPLQNDGDQAQAGEHRILRVLDWVEHIKRLGATCVLFNPLSIVRTLRRYRDGRPATTIRWTAAWAQTTTSGRSARRCTRRA